MSIEAEHPLVRAEPHDETLDRSDQNVISPPGSTAMPGIREGNQKSTSCMGVHSLVEGVVPNQDAPERLLRASERDGTPDGTPRARPWLGPMIARDGPWSTSVQETFDGKYQEAPPGEAHP